MTDKLLNILTQELKKINTSEKFKYIQMKLVFYDFHFKAKDNGQNEKGLVEIDTVLGLN